MNWALWLLGAIAVISAISLIWSSHALYSALSLVVTICALSVIFLILNAQFLFAVQIIVYAGAVMVLFVFIIALLNPRAEERPRVDWHMMLGILASIVAAVGVWTMAGSTAVLQNGQIRGAVVGRVANASSFSYGEQAVNAHGNVQTIAGQLFTTYLLPFEVSSLLLLVAAAGAVYLTHHARKGL